MKNIKTFGTFQINKNLTTTIETITKNHYEETNKK